MDPLLVDRKGRRGLVQHDAQGQGGQPARGVGEAAHDADGRGGRRRLRRRRRRLRVAGTTRTEHELVKLGSHHTLQIGLRARVSLRKAAWDAPQRAAVGAAADAASTADLACLLLDAERCRASSSCSRSGW